MCPGLSTDMEKQGLIIIHAGKDHGLWWQLHQILKGSRLLNSARVALRSSIRIGRSGNVGPAPSGVLLAPVLCMNLGTVLSRTAPSPGSIFPDECL